MAAIEILLKVITESVKVTLFVLVMMIAVDLINVKTKGKLDSILQTGRKWKQYFISSILGSAPGMPWVPLPVFLFTFTE